jgi:hypothetical protein
MSVDVVALGAWCDLVPPEECSASPGGASFVVHEFADLDDGRRVTLHTDRGFTSWTRSPGDRELHDPWSYLTAESIEAGVRTTVLPDDDQTEDEHPWEWLSGLLHQHGVEASVDGLKAVPYLVEFSERLSQRLGASGSCT